MSVPSISDFINKDDEETKATNRKKDTRDIEGELVLVREYVIGDIRRFVYWSEKLGVLINVYGRNVEESLKNAYEIYYRISGEKSLKETV